MGRSLAYDAIFVRGAGVALPLLLLALATASIGLGIKPALAKPAGRRRLAVDAAAFAWLARALAAVTCYDLAARASDMRVGADGLTDSGLWTRADYCALEARGDLPGQRGLHAYWSQGLPPVPAPSLLLAVGDAPGVLLVLGGGAAAALRVAWAPARASPAWAFLAWAVVASAHNRGGRYALDGGAVTLRALWVWVALLRAEGPRPEAPTPASVGLHLQICVIYWCAWLTKVCAPGTGWQLDAKTGRADAVCIALLLEEYSRAWVQRLSARLLVIPGACAVLTVGAAVIEVFGPMAALVATSTAARRGVAATFILFHASIGTLLQIGYFPLISCAAWAPFLAPIASGAAPRPRRRLLGGAAAMVVAWVQLSSLGTARRRSTCRAWPLLPDPPPPVVTAARHLDLAHTWDLFSHPTLLHNRRVRVVGNFAGEGFVDLLPLLRPRTRRARRRAAACVWAAPRETLRGILTPRQGEKAHFDELPRSWTLRKLIKSTPHEPLAAAMTLRLACRAWAADSPSGALPLSGAYLIANCHRSECGTRGDDFTPLYGVDCATKADAARPDDAGAFNLARLEGTNEPRELVPFGRFPGEDAAAAAARMCSAAGAVPGLPVPADPVACRVELEALVVQHT